MQKYVILLRIYKSTVCTIILMDYRNSMSIYQKSPRKNEYILLSYSSDRSFYTEI
jgi:hypothetical protein